MRVTAAFSAARVGHRFMSAGLRGCVPRVRLICLITVVMTGESVLTFMWLQPLRRTLQPFERQVKMCGFLWSAR